MNFIYLSLILVFFTFSKAHGEAETLWTAPGPPKSDVAEAKKVDPPPETLSPVAAPVLVPKKEKKPEVKTIKKLEKSKGNIPAEYYVASRRESTNSELVVPSKGAFNIFAGLRIGESVSVNVPASVIAFIDEKAPVVGIAESGSSLYGTRFVGESSLEKNSKRVFINFSKFVNGQEVYDFKGAGVSDNGHPWFLGEHYSKEFEFFSGDFIASFVAAYFDGLVPRRVTMFGTVETDNSVDSAVKKGFASGAMSSAERFREKLKKVPEFSEIKGPFNLKILVLEQAKMVN